MNEKTLWELVKRIPGGSVVSYKHLASLLGTSARAVGQVLNTNQELVTIPCHRVVKKNGRLGGYKLGRKRKKELLREEGVVIEDDEVSEDCFHEF